MYRGGGYNHIRQIVPSVPVRSDAREHTDDRSPFLKYRTGDDWHIMQLNKTIWVNLPKGRGTKLQGLFWEDGSQLQTSEWRADLYVCFFIVAIWSDAARRVIRKGWLEEDGVTLGTVKYSISLSNTGKHGWLHLALDLSRAIGNSWCNDSYHVNFAFNCRSDLRQTVRQHRILGNAFVQRAEFIWKYLLAAFVLFCRSKDLPPQDWWRIWCIYHVHRYDFAVRTNCMYLFRLLLRNASPRKWICPLANQGTWTSFLYYFADRSVSQKSQCLS